MPKRTGCQSWAEAADEEWHEYRDRVGRLRELIFRGTWVTGRGLDYRTQVRCLREGTGTGTGLEDWKGWVTREYWVTGKGLGYG